MSATVTTDATDDSQLPAGQNGQIRRRSNAPSSRDHPPTMDPRRRTLVLASMCLALLLVIAGVSMLAVGLSRVGEALSLSQTSLTWVADAYALTLASLLLLAGAIGDRFGRRRALVVGVAIFALGSLMSALASTGGELIAFRALTGIGGALVMPGTLSTITSVFPAEERARAVGIWAGFAGAGGTLGMLAAGWLLDNFSWKSIFFVTAGLGVLTFLAVLAVVPETRSSEHVGLDPLGTIFSALAIGSFVLGVIEGPIRGWVDPLSTGALAAGIGFGVAFVFWELRAEHPLLDPRLFRYRGFATGSASLLVMFVAMFGLFIVILQYLQLILGYSSLKAAVALLPMAALMIPVSTFAATLSMRYGQRIIGGAGLAIGGVGLFVFATLDAASGYTGLLIAQLTLALGMGLAMTPATNAIVGSLPPSKQGVASAVNDTTREIGTALGIAIMGSMFTSGYRSALSGKLAGLPADVAAQAKESPGLGLQAAGRLGAAGDGLGNAIRSSFTSGMRLSMIVGASVMLAAAAFLSLRGPSRAQETAEDIVDILPTDVMTA